MPFAYKITGNINPVGVWENRAQVYFPYNNHKWRKESMGIRFMGDHSLFEVGNQLAMPGSRKIVCL